LSGHWLVTGAGSAGAGYACPALRAGADSRHVIRVATAHSLPLAMRRQDKALHGSEPENPLE